MIVLDGETVDFADLFGGEYGTHAGIINHRLHDKIEAEAAPPAARRCTIRPFFQDV